MLIWHLFYPHLSEVNLTKLFNEIYNNIYLYTLSEKHYTHFQDLKPTIIKKQLIGGINGDYFILGSKQFLSTYKHLIKDHNVWITSKPSKKARILKNREIDASNLSLQQFDKF